MYIEQYHSYDIKIRHIKNITLISTTIPNKVLLNTVEQTRSTRLCLSRKKVENKLNKSLLQCLVPMCKFTHFHFSTKSCKHISDILLWDRLNICGIASLLNNTQTLQSLFELLSIKEQINYQHHDMETIYTHMHMYI